MAFALAPLQAQNILPNQGSFAPGAVSLHYSGPNLSVTQTSPRAIVNWGSFSIGQGDAVTFDQPNASSAILNRVTGSARSSLAGQLDANGQVYLVNPNGIAITTTGAVQVGGGFVASTLGIADKDFNSGNLNFVGNGASAGVANAGSIQAAPGGFVGLLGGTVSNSGVVSVPLGKVAMGSGEQATLNLTGDNFLQVAVPTNTKTADGQALIDVSGKVRAAGGSVQLKAATVAQAIRNAVNVPGELSVSSARASGGSIILSGGAGGNVAVTGRLKASGRTSGGMIAINGQNVALSRAKLAASSAAGRGGSVIVAGTNAVSLASTAVDASGATGGGAIRIGGDFHGASDIASAQTTTIDSASTLNASATASGNGGTVAVWSDATTNFAGGITATGGPNGGDGGYTEVSANPVTHGVLDFTGIADLTAPKGATGTLLLDPYDIVISTGMESGGSFSGGVWTPTATSVINNTTLESQLAISNVIISTGGAGSPGSDAGNITVSAPISWLSNSSLTLEAYNSIFLDAQILAPRALIALSAGSDIIQPAQFNGVSTAITDSTLTAISANGRVVLTADNAISSTVSGSAPLGFSIADALPLSVGGITSTSGPIALAGLAGITQTGPIKGQSLFAGTVSGDVILTNPNNSVATVAGDAGVSNSFLNAIASAVGQPSLPPGVKSGPGTFQFYDSNANLSIGGVNGYVSTSNNNLVSETSSGIGASSSNPNGVSIAVFNVGNLTVNSAVQSLSSIGTVQLAATDAFTNNVGPAAIATSGGTWQVYSASPSGDVFDDLNSGATAVWNTRFGQPVTVPGDRYVFAFQPTITVTSGNLTKFDGQDVTSLVAADYTISGLEPGLPGAFLGDSAAAVYSGTPLVTSLGSPASAPLSGSPYPITVAPGTFTVSNDYALVLDSTGKLTVAPIPTANPGAPTDPGFLPGLTQINNPAQTEYDVGGYEQVLPRFTVNCNEPPSLPDPNRYSDPDQALRAISQSLENYFRRCQNPTQTTIADALDAYAAKLQVLAPRLPPALRNVPTIIAEGARRVRAARSRTEALAVLRQTIAAVHKEIALVLSEDPGTRSRELRDGDVIEGALGATSVALVNSGGL